MAKVPESASQRQTSRGQVSRIDRSYFHRSNPLQIARRWLILACLGLGVGWAAWGAFDQPLHHAPGPVAAVHAKWEQDCQACHVPFAPIKDNTWLSTAATRHAMDAKCESCHSGAAHHPLQDAAEVGSCASCHTDHRGRGADIARVADQTCTACHGEIAAHRLVNPSVPPTSVVTPITRFDNDHHPAFAGLAADPGRLKFSHGRHMRAGLTFGPTAAGGPAGGWTYAMLAPSDRDRYQPPAAAAGDLVQLSCASCHEFGSSLPADTVRSVSNTLAAAPAGAYALPVDFERHCAACHSLPYDGLASPRGGGPAGGVDAEPADVLTLPAQRSAAGDHGPEAGSRPGRSDQTLPHGLDAAGIATFLETRFLRDALAGNAALLDAPPPRRPLPVPREAGGAALAGTRQVVDEQVRRGLTFARGTCEKCHEIRGTTLPDAAHLFPAGRADVPWFEVLPTQVPDIWLTKSRFDHRPHRGFDCRGCHAAAYPDEPDATAAENGSPTSVPVGSPLDNGQVMIAGRESCTACHAPAARDPVTGTMVGGARFDCVECHGYHGLGPHSASPVSLTGVSQRGAASHVRPE